MGAVTTALTNSDKKELLTTLEKFSKKNKVNIFFDKEKLNQVIKGDFPFVELKFVELDTTITLYKMPLSDSTKKELPIGTRKLKNAKTIFYYRHSISKDATKLLIELLTLHPSNGYVQPNDCGYGDFIEVTDKGLRTGFLKDNPQMNNLIMYYNDLSELYGGKVDFITRAEFLSLNESNIRAVFYKRKKTDLKPNQTTKNNNYYTDIVIMLNSGEVPFIVRDTDLYLVDGDTITSAKGVYEKINSIDKKKHKVIKENQPMNEVFTFIR